MSADALHRLIRQAEQSIAQDPPSALSRQSVLAVCQAIEAGSPALLRPLFEVVDQMAAVGS